VEVTRAFWRFAVLLLLCFPCTADPLRFEAIAVRVIDGDTIDVLTDQKVLLRVRLAGIDAPEKGQPFAAAATQVLADLVLKKRILFEGSKRDRYGRIVGKVVVGGIDANLQMVRSGYAWHFKKYQREQAREDRVAYAEAERAARHAGLGVWHEPGTMAPWAYRAARGW
jgi:endonuclease YncB( thermonuclease family)